jgi:hypothetical protein
MEEKVSQRIGNDFNEEFKREFKAFLDPNNPSYIGDEDARTKKAESIKSSYRPAQNLAQSNIAAGNYRINAANLLQAAKDGMNPSFVDNPNNFILGKDKKPIVKEILGQAHAQTKGGVWIPVN